MIPLRVVEIGKDFRDLIELLNRHGVRYAERLIAALDDFGFANLGLRVDDFLDPDVVIQLGYEPNRVDLLTQLDGVEFADAYPLRTSIRIGELDVPVIDRASLIANKRAIGRPRDLEDAKELEG